MHEEPFKWVVLAADTPDSGSIIACPSEWIADNIMENHNGFLAVKYPRMRVR